MTSILRHSDTCQVKQVSSNKLVEAVVQDFREKELVTVILNKSIKMQMKWNGKVYEGRMAGMDFTSNGPTITRTSTGSRG
jgi:hypothetical protein